MKADQDRKRRRSRCHKHEDMLTEDHCPRCEVERLKKLNAELVEATGLYGDKAKVFVSYRLRGVFNKLVRILAVPGGKYTDKSVNIGHGSASGGDSVTLPLALAEALADLAKEMDDEYIKAMLHGYSDGLQIVSHSMTAVFDRLTSHQVKLDAKKLRKLFAKDKYFRGEFNIARDALQKELFAIFDED